MFSKLVRATVALTLTSSCIVQAQFATKVPAAEASALAGIVEDDPASFPKFKKAGSPAYTLYSAALPIPAPATPK
jgi:bilirubin oxidase